jgi:hypothetical protein
MQVPYGHMLAEWLSGMRLFNKITLYAKRKVLFYLQFDHLYKARQLDH